jgi:hypothetical protein
MLTYQTDYYLFTFSGPISFRYQCIVVYFRRLLSTVKMDYEENMENARYESMPRMMTLLSKTDRTRKRESRKKKKFPTKTK